MHCYKMWNIQASDAVSIVTVFLQWIPGNFFDVNLMRYFYILCISWHQNNAKTLEHILILMFLNIFLQWYIHKYIPNLFVAKRVDLVKQ